MKSLIDDCLGIIAQSQGIILDSNVAVLWVVGSTDPKQVPYNDRTSGYRVNDFWTIDGIVRQSKAHFTIPHTLTEISNLGGRSRIFRDVFRSLFRPIEELPIQSTQAWNSDYFLSLGLTDALLLECARLNYLVVTADHTLCSFISGQGHYCINFNYLKEVQD